MKRAAFTAPTLAGVLVVALPYELATSSLRSDGEVQERGAEQFPA